MFQRGGMFENGTGAERIERIKRFLWVRRFHLVEFHDAGGNFYAARAQGKQGGGDFKHPIPNAVDHPGGPNRTFQLLLAESREF